jgi:phosphoribosylanthranilate isomerase
MSEEIKGADMLVRISGIRNEADLAAVVNANANAVGFLVGVTSPNADALEIAEAKPLIRLVPPFMSAVLATQLTDPTDIVVTHRELGTGAIQLQGDITDDAVRVLREELPQARLIKVLYVTASRSVDELVTRAKSVTDYVDAFMLDSRTEGKLSGTGEVHDWELARQVRDQITKPVILAGGLRPSNVARAVGVVRPSAVDVNSGVETPKGDKDPEACQMFVISSRAL